jgi:hypothetical protein
MIVFSKKDLLAKLPELMSDHSKFLTAEEAVILGEPVRLIPKCFKTAHGYGIYAGEFIDQLCSHLDIGYLGKFGRLSQLRKELSDE